MLPKFSIGPTRVLIVDNYPGITSALKAIAQSDKRARNAAKSKNEKDVMKWLEEKGRVFLASNAESARAINPPESPQKKAVCDILVVDSQESDSSFFARIEEGESGCVLKNLHQVEITVHHETSESGALTAISPPSLDEEKKQKNATERKIIQQGLVDSVSVPLTPRETTILQLMARGDTYSQIGDTLFITVRTVESHVKNIFRKMKVHSRAEAVFEAHQNGYLPNLAPVTQKSF